MPRRLQGENIGNDLGDQMKLGNEDSSSLLTPMMVVVKRLEGTFWIPPKGSPGSSPWARVQHHPRRQWIVAVVPSSLELLAFEVTHESLVIAYRCKVLSFMWCNIAFSPKFVRSELTLVCAQSSGTFDK